MNIYNIVHVLDCQSSRFYFELFVFQFELFVTSKWTVIKNDQIDFYIIIIIYRNPKILELRVKIWYEDS